jgi:hypothetical protein
MQLNLPLADLPCGNDSLWEQLDPTTREAVIDALAQAITQVLRPKDLPHGENEND